MKIILFNAGIRVLYAEVERDKDTIKVYLTPHATYEGFSRVEEKLEFEV